MRLLKIARAVFGIGQKELATAAGVSIRELARIETGEVRPGMPVLEKLDAALIGLLDERMRAVRSPRPVG